MHEGEQQTGHPRLPVIILGTLQSLHNDGCEHLLRVCVFVWERQHVMCVQLSRWRRYVSLLSLASVHKQLSSFRLRMIRMLRGGKWSEITQISRSGGKEEEEGPSEIEINHLDLLCCAIGML